jgi:hypothetical protein
LKLISFTKSVTFFILPLAAFFFFDKTIAFAADPKIKEKVLEKVKDAYPDVVQKVKKTATGKGKRLGGSNFLTPVRNAGPLLKKLKKQFANQLFKVPTYVPEIKHLPLLQRDREYHLLAKYIVQLNSSPIVQRTSINRYETGVFDSFF